MTLHEQDTATAPPSPFAGERRVAVEGDTMSGNHSRRKNDGGDLRYRHELVEQGRLDRKLTQAEAAAMVDLTQGALSLIEGGEWPPSLFNATRIADMYGRPLDDFIERKDGKPPSDAAILPRADFERLRAIEAAARAAYKAQQKDDPAAVRRALKKLAEYFDVAPSDPSPPADA